VRSGCGVWRQDGAVRPGGEADSFGGTSDGRNSRGRREGGRGEEEPPQAMSGRRRRGGGQDADGHQAAAGRGGSASRGRTPVRGHRRVRRRVPHHHRAGQHRGAPAPHGHGAAAGHQRAVHLLLGQPGGGHLGAGARGGRRARPNATHLRFRPPRRGRPGGRRKQERQQEGDGFVTSVPHDYLIIPRNGWASSPAAVLEPAGQAATSLGCRSASGCLAMEKPMPLAWRTARMERSSGLPVSESIRESASRLTCARAAH